MHSLYRFLIEGVLKAVKESAFINVSVGELLFDGYDDPLVAYICSNKYLKQVCKLMQIPEKIGLFYKVNFA